MKRNNLQGQVVALETEKLHLENEIERLNNDIKELLKENGNKEKVIKAQDSIIKEVREYRNVLYHRYYEKGFDTDSAMIIKELDKILDKEK